MINNQCEYCPQNAQTGNCVGLDDKKVVALDELKMQIKHALATLYEQDYDLLKRKVDERSISHRFAHYFENEFERDYPGYHFDIEYQKDGKVPKYYSIQYARPDFIIHRRNCNKHNLVVIEFKPYWGDEHRYENDFAKLQALTSSESQFCRDGIVRCYKYTYGVHVVLNRRSVPCTIFFYKNGEAEPFSTDDYEYQGVKAL